MKRDRKKLVSGWLLTVAVMILFCSCSKETDSLPETLEAHKSREWIVMNLDAVKEFFGIGFKKPLFLLGH